MMIHSRGRTGGTNRLRTATILIAIAFICVPASGAAAQTGVFSGDLSKLSDEEVGLRYDFITQRLDAGQRNSQIWQYGFTSGWGVGVVIGATQASLASDEATLASGIVTSVKAAGGVARLLLSPNPGRHGSEDLQALPATSQEDRLRRLAAAEALLGDVEERALDRLDWKRHAGNVGVNLAGAGVILAVGEADNDSVSAALVSFGVGVIAGEVMSFTMPWRGVNDAKDYRGRFLAGPREPKVSWSIAPMPNGLSLHVTF